MSLLGFPSSGRGSDSHAAAKARGAKGLLIQRNQGPATGVGVPSEAQPLREAGAKNTLRGQF